jgi:hypothetical protein
MPKANKDGTLARQPDNLDIDPENLEELVEDPPGETSTPPGAAFKDDPTQSNEDLVPAPNEAPKGSNGQKIPGKPISDMDPPGQDEPGGLE